MTSEGAMPISTAYIACGSNLGDRSANHLAAREAIDALPSTRLEMCSRLYESDALTLPGGDPQPPYLNAVVAVRTTLSPHDLLHELLAIEKGLGRERSAIVRWAPRTIDLDLLLHSNSVFEKPGLTLPHPRMHERLFVLEPLSEIAPGAHHPLLKKSIEELLADLLAASDSVA